MALKRLGRYAFDREKVVCVEDKKPAQGSRATAPDEGVVVQFEGGSSITLQGEDAEAVREWIATLQEFKHSHRTSTTEG